MWVEAQCGSFGFEPFGGAWGKARCGTFSSNPFGGVWAEARYGTVGPKPFWRGVCRSRCLFFEPEPSEACGLKKWRGVGSALMRPKPFGGGRGLTQDRRAPTAWRGVGRGWTQPLPAQTVFLVRGKSTRPRAQTVWVETGYGPVGPKLFPGALVEARRGPSGLLCGCAGQGSIRTFRPEPF